MPTSLSLFAATAIYQKHYHGFRKTARTKQEDLRRPWRRLVRLSAKPGITADFDSAVRNMGALSFAGAAGEGGPKGVERRPFFRRPMGPDGV
jgi:hypothetical protein